MTKLELLNETIQYFSEDTTRRCIKAGSATESRMCAYHPKTVKLEGKTEGCAIGRKLSEKTALYFDSFNGTLSIQVMYSDPKKWKMLPEWMQKMSVIFLNDLQKFHDEDKFWNKRKGLTARGKKILKEVMTNHELGEYNPN